MTSAELRVASERLYGNGLINRVYIRALAKDLQTSESTVRQWWYGILPGIPTEAKMTIDSIKNERGRF
ncbi:MAG: hypothetical protein HQL69_11580 [Magnetococcales bacterium]|nr:hypothetical protein [Magnetococcales bacterium]